MNDYELYRVLEDNGYETTNENLAILKEGLDSGEIILTEAAKKSKKAEDFKKEAEDYASDGKTKSARLGRVIKGVGKAALGAVVGAGLGGTAGAIAGNAMDTDAASKAAAASEAASSNAAAAQKKVDDAAADLKDIESLKPQSASSDSGNRISVDKPKITSKITPNKDPDVKDLNFEKSAGAEETADKSYESAKKAASDRYDQAKSEKKATDDAAASAAKSKEDAAADHSKRKIGTIAGAAGGGVAGAYVGARVHAAQHEKELDDEGDYRAYRRAAKRLGRKGIAVDLKESSDEELRDLLDINGFESDDANIATLRENGALILSADGIALTEGMAPEYALMKLLDANGFEPTADNVKVLNAGLDSGSILLK